MDQKMMYEIVGYIASGLVAISLTMSSILRLRIINLVGAAFFSTYGLLIGAYPIVIVNIAIILINLYYLFQIFTSREYFTLLEVRHDSEYLESFLRFHAAGIQKFLPGFTHTPSDSHLIIFILRDMIPAGLFIAAPRQDGSLWVLLDFVIPGYRDFKIGQFLFEEKADFLHQKGIEHIFSAPGTPTHASYLRRMGFSPDGDSYSRKIGLS
jgi:hypothetical protein